jgi:hypothetical protein
MIYESHSNMVCTNHAPLRSISFYHVSMHAVVNHVYPIRRPCCSYTSITIYACTTFPIEDGLSHLRFFTSARRRAKALLSMGVPIALPTRSDNNSLTQCFPPAARGSFWFLLTPRRRCKLGFLDTCDTINIVFLFLWFF